MDLDSFLISIMFDNQKTKESAQKVDSVISSLIEKVASGFTAIMSIDFLKNAIDSSIKLATKLDNLSYMTNISKENLSAWGEAVKRNGGTTDSFYSSISSVSDKIRDMQTNFGSAGQSVFFKLGISLKDANGHIKNAVQVLGDVGNKIKDMPKVWQLDIGKKLGLDEATIRLISSGSEEANKLVQNMMKMSGVNQVNTEQNLKLRNSLYDISLIWDSMKLTISNFLIPYVATFSEILVKSFNILQEHSKIVHGVLFALSVLIGGIIYSSMVSLARMILTTLIPAILKMSAAFLTNPIFLIGVALVALGFIIQDLVVHLRGGKSAFGDFYDYIGNLFANDPMVRHFKYIISLMDNMTEKIRNFFGIKQIDDPMMIAVEAIRNERKLKENPTDKNTIKNGVEGVAISSGFDPQIASTIANIESGYDSSAKSKTSSASGVFQLTDATAIENGIKNLKDKNDATENIIAGINHLKKISSGLKKFFGREASGKEVYLGEMLGLAGSEKVFSSKKDTPLSAILSPSVLKANPQYQKMTSGQLISKSNKTYDQKSISVGNININAPHSDAKQISKHIDHELKKQLSDTAINLDNGVFS